MGNSQCIEVVFIIRGNEMALEEPLAEVGASGILSLKEYSVEKVPAKMTIKKLSTGRIECVLQKKVLSVWDSGSCSFLSSISSAGLSLRKSNYIMMLAIFQIHLKAYQRS